MAGLASSSARPAAALRDHEDRVGARAAWGGAPVLWVYLSPETRPGPAPTGRDFELAYDGGSTARQHCRIAVKDGVVREAVKERIEAGRV